MERSLYDITLRYGALAPVISSCFDHTVTLGRIM